MLLDAQAITERTEERWYESELHRTNGDVLLAKGRATIEVEHAYTLAIDVARRQHAKLFELRATTSLARLWHAQGRIAEARALLQPVYDWFTEGFDTPDLRAAKDLLGQLTPA